MSPKIRRFEISFYYFNAEEEKEFGERIIKFCESIGCPKGIGMKSVSIHYEKPDTDARTPAELEADRIHEEEELAKMDHED